MNIVGGRSGGYLKYTKYHQALSDITVSMRFISKIKKPTFFLCCFQMILPELHVHNICLSVSHRDGLVTGRVSSM